MSEQKIFLTPRLKVEEGDRAVLSPVWILSAEVFSRSMLKRPTYTYRTIILDAMTGNPILTQDGDVNLGETSERPDARILEPAIERTRTPFLAEKAIGNTRPQGWRSIGNCTSVHIDPDKTRLRWRLVILRNGTPLDGLTGKPLVGSELLIALLAETAKERGGS